jgi:hypothetical protein
MARLATGREVRAEAAREQPFVDSTGTAWAGPACALLVGKAAPLSPVIYGTLAQHQLARAAYRVPRC